jgi:hypothetical protein
MLTTDQARHRLGERVLRPGVVGELAHGVVVAEEQREACRRCRTRRSARPAARTRRPARSPGGQTRGWPPSRRDRSSCAARRASASLPFGGVGPCGPTPYLGRCGGSTYSRASIAVASRSRSPYGSLVTSTRPAGASTARLPGVTRLRPDASRPRSGRSHRGRRGRRGFVGEDPGPAMVTRWIRLRLPEPPSRPARPRRRPRAPRPSR